MAILIIPTTDNKAGHFYLPTYQSQTQGTPSRASLIMISQSQFVKTLLYQYFARRCPGGCRLHFLTKCDLPHKTLSTPRSNLGSPQRIAPRLFQDSRLYPGVNVYGTLDADKSVAIVSFTIAERQVSEIGLRLDEEYGILCRVGLHCAPAAHETIGSFSEGTIRLAPGVFTTMDDVHTTIRAIEDIIRS